MVDDDDGLPPSLRRVNKRKEKKTTDARGLNIAKTSLLTFFFNISRGFGNKKNGGREKKNFGFDTRC